MPNPIPPELARLRAQVAQITKGQRIAHGAALEDSALEVRDQAGGLRAIVGQQADGTSGIQVVNGPPPPQPTAPIVASVLGGVTASWDGLFTDGALIPLDWSRIEVHASPTDGFVPVAETLQNTIETAQGATVVVPTDDPVYVRFLARSTSGTPSLPSTQAGPYGPAPVVSTDIADGIVTTVKLADDAVTAAKVAVGAIDTDAIAAAAVTETAIAASAVTAGKIAASQVQALHLTAGAVHTVALAADSVAAGKVAADAITAREIQALAITTPKLDANVVTTSKLAAGSVDATALKADAITGKTITGGVINGAEFHSDNGAGATVDIADGNIIGTAATGWKVIMAPTDALPGIGFIDGAGGYAGVINGTGINGLPALNISSGPFTDGAVSDWRWITRSGPSESSNFWRTRRVRQSNTNYSQGGVLFAGPTWSFLGYADSEDPSVDSYVRVDSGSCRLMSARLIVEPPATNNSAIIINAKTAHTGFLYRAQVEGADRFSVSMAGAVAATGPVTAAGALSGASLTIDGTEQGRGQTAFQARSTATTASATEQIALTQAGVVLKTGRAYRVQVRGLAQAATAAAGVRVRVRKTNVSGAIWLDTFTVATPTANTNVQYNNQQVIINTTGSAITTTLVMTWVTASGSGTSFLNAGGGLYTAFEVTDIGAASDYSTAQAVT